MRKLLMMMALMAGMTAQANEMNDTTVISKAEKVTIMTSDTIQKIQILGQDGNADYRYEKSVPLNAYKMKKLRKKKDEKETTYFEGDLGVGIGVPTNAPEGYGFAAFKSGEIFLGLRYCYTPKNALQTYSVGLWFDWRQYGLSTNKMFVKDQYNVVSLENYPEKASSRSSKINIFSLSVPFMFTQKFGQKSKCKLMLGPVVNFNVYGRINNSYEMGDVETSDRIKGLEYRPVTIDLMAAFQYKGIGAYFKYSPMSVLKTDKGPQFRSLTFGLYF